jgi:hypothetical protein
VEPGGPGGFTQATLATSPLPALGT